MFLADTPAYGLAPADKAAFLSQQLTALVEHHAARCAPYGRFVANWHRPAGPRTRVEDFPFLPVTVFKEFSLLSTTAEVMSVKSSATTSGQSSVVFVDKETRKRQTLSANKIWTDFLGGKRRPYLVFDLESTVRGTASMSARGAAILSLAPLASEFFFVAREEAGTLVIDFPALTAALKKIGDQPLAGYGFTYILYQLHQELAAAGYRPPAPLHADSVLLHSGGWKRLIDQAVDKETFNRQVAAPWGLDPRQVIDFYGAVEQVGLLYPDCTAGRKHAPYWAEVLLRHADTMDLTPVGQVGLLQLVNCLPLSAPNHSVLTEDLGRLECEDGCPCGRRGRAFTFIGRAPRSEVRGCSDVGRG